MNPDVSAEACAARIEAASALSDLDAGKRLDAKLDMTAEGVSGRLHEAFELLALCEDLRRRRSPS